MSNHRKGQIGLLIVAIIWGSGFIASSIALESFLTIHILALRFTIAFVIMLALFNKHLKEMTRSTVLKGAVLGIILYSAFYFQTVGLQYTTASKNAFLTATNVVIVPFMSALIFKNGINRQTKIGAVLSLFGVGFMSLNEFGQLNYGDIITLICAIMFALQILFTNQFLSNENLFNLNMVQMGTAALLGTIFSFIRGDAINFSSMSGNVSVIYLGAVSTMIAYLLQTASQRYTNETETAIILSAEAVFGMIFSALFLSEQITLRMIIGAALIFVGAVVVQYKPKNKMKFEM